MATPRRPRKFAVFSRAILPLLAVAAPGCSDPEWVGTYTTTGRWNLSGPLADGRSSSDALADLLIAEVADSAPLPDRARDGIAAGLSALIHDRLRALVEAHAPDELRADGAITALLATSLGDLRVESVVVLDDGGDGIEGTETFTAFELGGDVDPLRVLFADLAGAKVEAEWAGEDADGRFQIEPHPVALRYGELVRLAAARALTAEQLAALEADVHAALDCPTLVTDLLDGRTSFEVDAGLFSLSVGAGPLTSACGEVRGLISERALGVFALDASVEIGGTIEFADEDGDGALELKSRPEFGGVLSIGPESIAPKVTVAFSGRRSR